MKIPRLLSLMCCVCGLSACATTLNGWDGSKCGVYERDPDNEALTILGQTVAGVTSKGIGLLSQETPPALPEGAPISPEACAQASVCVYYTDESTDVSCTVIIRQRAP